MIPNFFCCSTIPLRILLTVIYGTEQIKKKLVPRGADKPFDSIMLLWWKTFKMKKYGAVGDCKNAPSYLLQSVSVPFTK